MNKPTISRILLLTPYRENDPRWQSILFSPATLLLASGLEEHGFSTCRRRIPLPYIHAENAFRGFDAVGLTLFEDLADDYAALIEAIRQDHTGLLMAGGPMASRLPDTCLQLFPEIDLLLRGEAEEALPQVLRWINTPGSPPPPVSGLYLKRDDGWFTLEPQRLNRPQKLEKVIVNYDLLEDDELGEGLELNISRGCPRSCVFCCHVQGRNPRRLNPDALDRQLAQARKRIERLHPIPPRAMSININDDDLLISPEYARSILDVCRGNGFHLWGLQTAVDSFFDHRRRIKLDLLDLVADPDLYMDRPLLWLGTDTFLEERSRRMGKTIPPAPQFLQLLDQFEQRKIRHYHYWISSDQESDWPEFIEELSFIQHLRQQYPLFGLLAHAPFLIPYPDTPLWHLLERSPEHYARILFSRPVRRSKSSWKRALRVEPRDPGLTRLLDNQPDPGGIRFFEALKDNDNFAVFSSVYNALRESRLRCGDARRIELLLQQEEMTAERLSRLMPGGEPRE